QAGRDDARAGAAGAATALPADARRDRGREELDDRVPAADGPHQAADREAVEGLSVPVILSEAKDLLAGAMASGLALADSRKVAGPEAIAPEGLVVAWRIEVLARRQLGPTQPKPREPSPCLRQLPRRAPLDSRECATLDPARADQHVAAVG